MTAAFDPFRRFAYRLALAIGVWDVDGLLRAMTFRQLLDWARYYQLEPFGEQRADLRAGIVASVIAEANRDSKKRPEPFQPRDFMWFVEDDPRPPSAATRRPMTDPAAWERTVESVKSYAQAIPARGRG